MMRRYVSRVAVALVLATAVIGLSSAALVAQQAQPGQQNEFEPVKNLPALQQEHIPAAPLVEAAYAFVWVALLVYVWSVWRRVGAVQRELDDLRRRTERRA